MISLKATARPLTAGYYSVEDTLNSELIAEFLKCLADDLGSIIVDDSSRYAKAIYHVMFDELNHVEHLYLF